jgi:hypothetical protein
MTEHDRDTPQSAKADSGGPRLGGGEAGDPPRHVDITQAKRFLECLDPIAQSFSFQTFDDDSERKSEKLAKVRHGTLGRHAYELIQLNKAGAGVFVTVNETNGTGRKAENITRVRAVFVDLDGSPLQPVMRHNLEPHIVVESSPEKWHCYWLIDGLYLEDFRAVQLELIKLFDADPVVHDLPRVMRLPGFIHRKASPFRSRIVSTHDRDPYPAGYFGKAEIVQHVSGEKKPATDLERWLVGEALEVIPAALDFETRNHVGMAVWRATDKHEYGFEVWSEWLKRSGKYIERKAKARWLHYSRFPPTALGIGTLIFMAREVEPLWYERMMYELMDMPLE